MITTMKKIYRTPNTVVVGIKANKMIATSQIKTLEKTIDNKSDVLGREDNAWDIWGSDDEAE